MKAFTAIFAISAMLGTALATPINVGDTAVEQRDVEVDNAARQLIPPLPIPTIPYVPVLPTLPPLPTLPTLPTLGPLPTLPSLTLPTLGPIPGLPTLPPIPIPANPPDLVTALRIALTQIINILTAIRSNLPDTAGLPPLPPLPPLPTLPGIPNPIPIVPTPLPGVPTSPETILAQLTLLQSKLANLQSIFSNPPTGVSADQLKDVLSTLQQIQTQTQPVIAKIFSLLGSSTLPLPGTPGSVDGVTAAVGAILSLFGSIFGLLPGLYLGQGGFTNFGR